jgi:hypothetical protein
MRRIGAARMHSCNGVKTMIFKKILAVAAVAGMVAGSPAYAKG